MGSSYFIYGNYCRLRTFLLLAWRVLRYIKMSVRNQLTHYELEEFFRSLQDLLVLSLNPSLSFDSAEFLSRRLDGFELWAFCLQDYAFRIGPKYNCHNYFLTSTLSYLWPVKIKGNIVRTTLFRFARGGGRATFNRQGGCCEIRCSRPPEARYFRRFVGGTS